MYIGRLQLRIEQKSVACTFDIQYIALFAVQDHGIVQAPVLQLFHVLL